MFPDYQSSLHPSDKARFELTFTGKTEFKSHPCVKFYAGLHSNQEAMIKGLRRNAAFNLEDIIQHDNDIICVILLF